MLPFPLPKSTSESRSSRSQRWTVWQFFQWTLIALVAWMGPGSEKAWTQQTTQSRDSITRSNPAPWRPAFGAAVPKTLTNGQESPGSVSPQKLPSQASTSGSLASSNDSGVRVAAKVDQPGVTRVTRSLSGNLPNDAGQVWREYDISPYTSKIKTTENPEKAVLDWILRETGTEMWFTPPLGLLNVDSNKLYVYHTPEIQSVVKKMVDRFVHTRGQVQTVDVNLVTLGNPNWRSQSYTMLQPIEVKSPGVEAWLISKENAAILMGQLSRRADYRHHSGGRLTNHDGQSFSLDKTRPVQFIRNLRWTPNQFPSFQPLMTTLNEGYKLQLSCLTTLDNSAIEATIKCDVDQVENLNEVVVNVPVPGGIQPVTLQVPQLVSWRLHERFRWPSDEVLLLSCGVVASPEPDPANRPAINFPGVKKRVKRADALLFIDYRGPATGATIRQATHSASGNTTNGMRPFDR